MMHKVYYRLPLRGGFAIEQFNYLEDGTFENVKTYLNIDTARIDIQADRKSGARVFDLTGVPENFAINQELIRYLIDDMNDNALLDNNRASASAMYLSKLKPGKYFVAFDNDGKHNLDPIGDYRIAKCEGIMDAYMKQSHRIVDHDIWHLQHNKTMVFKNGMIIKQLRYLSPAQSAALINEQYRKSLVG